MPHTVWERSDTCPDSSAVSESSWRDITGWFAQDEQNIVIQKQQVKTSFFPGFRQTCLETFGFWRAAVDPVFYIHKGRCGLRPKWDLRRWSCVSASLSSLLFGYGYFFSYSSSLPVVQLNKQHTHTSSLVTSVMHIQRWFCQNSTNTPTKLVGVLIPVPYLKIMHVFICL